MKKLTNITAIIFIVIASCGKSQKEINRERNMHSVTYGTALSTQLNASTSPLLRGDSIVKQEIRYANRKYVLRTVAIFNLGSYGGGVKEETAEINFLLFTIGNKNAIAYDKTITGSFNYIKSEKVNQFKLAGKYLINAYKAKSIQDKKANLINDSVELLNKIQITTP